MTQYNNLNVELSNYQLNKLKSGIKTDSEVTLNLSSNLIVDSNDEINFHINYYQPIHKFQGFEKLLEVVHQLI